MRKQLIKRYRKELPIVGGEIKRLIYIENEQLKALEDTRKDLKKYRKKRWVRLSYLAKDLSYREKEILKYRWEDRMSLEEVGVIFDVTRERIRMIEAKIFNKLKL